MEKMDSSLIHRSCTFIIVSSVDREKILSWNRYYQLMDSSLIHRSGTYIIVSSYSLVWIWTHHLFIMYIYNSLFIFEVEMEKMDSSLIHRSCTFIIVSSYFLSWNGKDGLITNSSFMYVHNSIFIFFKLTWKRWTHH